MSMYESIEYDQNKSRSNKQKHGINFIEASQILNDSNAILLPANKVKDEIRFALIGIHNKKIWTVILTERKNRIRIISARRARKEEVDLYERN